MIQHSTFAQFEADWQARGYPDCIERVWEPGFNTGVHTHPFDVKAQVQSGEFWLTVGDQVRHVKTGEWFELDRNVPHAERYGLDGAVFWVARRT
jgi:hypothetical protein